MNSLKFPSPTLGQPPDKRETGRFSHPAYNEVLTFGLPKRCR